jgi:hypothetical protein
MTTILPVTPSHHYDIDTSRGFATDQVLPLAAFLISLSLDDVARQEDPL